MSYKKDTIEIKLNSYGTLDVVCVPVKLYKDSYKVVKLRVLAPDKSGAVVKVYSTGRNVAGEQVWTSETHSVPSTNETKTFGDATYRVYETMLPQEFCLESGDLNLTFAQVVTTSGAEEIITSGTLNLYVGGEGFNYAGVKISDYDVLAGKVNEVIENAVNREDIAELEAKVENSASKDELQEAEDRLNTAIGKVDSDLKVEIADTEARLQDNIDAVDNKIDQLSDNVVTTNTEQTITAKKTFEVGGSYVVVDKDFATMQNRKSGANRINSVYVSNGKTQVGSMATDGTLFSGIEHDASSRTTNVTGTLNYYGKEVATVDQVGKVDANTLSGLIVDSDTIVHSVSGGKVQLNLDAEIQSQISKALVTPMSIPSATELVAVDNTGSQKMVEIGEGLSLENGTLKATGGVSGNFVTIDTTQVVSGEKTFDNLKAKTEYTESAGGTVTKQLSFNAQKMFKIKNSLNNREGVFSVDNYGGWFLGSDYPSGFDKYGINHSVDGTTDITGTLKYKGVEVATKNDITGGSSVTVVDTLVSQSTTDALSARQGNVLYNMIVDGGMETNQAKLDAHKQLILGANGVQVGNVYNFTVEDADSFLPYRTNLTKFLVDLELAISGAIDNTKEVTITFGDTSYYVYNVLTGMQHSTIGDLKQVDKYNNETGYRFIAEMTFFKNADIEGFAIIPTISMSDILALDSDQMDNYVADGGLTQGQLAVCSKVITNGYEVGALYRFDIVYPNTYSWEQIGYSKSGIDNAIKTAIQDTWGASY